MKTEANKGTSMTKDEALKLALEALEMWCPMTATYLNTRDKAITAIREALAQPEQKPLTNDRVWLEYMQLWSFRPNEEPTLAKDILRFARAIETAHGIKENT